jgi:hypothetical protein
MTVSVAPSTTPAGLLLVGLGTQQDLTILESLARRLAEAESMGLRQVSDADDPDASLSALTTGAGEAPGARGRHWLAALPVDPGLPLPRGGCWAEALGAWRQPCLLVMGKSQMATGLPAAGSALLERWRVPLLGLLQLGGAWEPLERRRDGLPWLGWLPPAPPEDPEALAALQLVLRRRGRRLETLGTTG